jgi:hypothetical protein
MVSERTAYLYSGPSGRADVFVDLRAWIHVQQRLVCANVLFEYLARRKGLKSASHTRENFPRPGVVRHAGRSLEEIVLIPDWDGSAEPPTTYRLWRIEYERQLWGRRQVSQKVLASFGSENISDLDHVRGVLEEFFGPIQLEQKPSQDVHAVPYSQSPWGE